MVDRKDVGSWLSGPPIPRVQDFPGQRLGLPERGRGSVARPGVRVAALLIDWASAHLIALGAVRALSLPDGSAAAHAAASLAPLLVLWLLNVAFVAAVGATVGHRLCGMQVTTLAGGRVGVVAALVRATSLCLGIPPLIWDADQRGLHDKAAGTVLRRTR